MSTPNVRRRIGPRGSVENGQDTVSAAPPAGRRLSRFSPQARIGVRPYHLLIWSFIIPIDIYLGDLRLSPYRIVLLLFMGPAIAKFKGNPNIKIHWADIAMMSFAVTGALSFLVNGDGVAAAGMMAVEAFGPFVIARAYITNADEFSSMARTVFHVTLFLIPFAAYESFTRDPILLTFLQKFFPNVQENVEHELRMGLDRAQVVFDHPILYGLFGSIGFSLVYFAVCYQANMATKIFKSALVCLATFFSLSSGAILSLVLQIIFIAWDFFLRRVPNKWNKLLLAFLCAYAFVAAFSNRTPIAVFISYFTFNAGNSYTRVLQFEYGILSVKKNPFFGFGYRGDWERLWWMPSSVDNFWLALAMRHGIPTSVSIILAVILVLFHVGKADVRDPRVRSYRLAAQLSLAGVSVAATTVHLWDAAYCMFMLLTGTGLWIADQAWVAKMRPAKHEAGEKDENKLTRRVRPIR